MNNPLKYTDPSGYHFIEEGFDINKGGGPLIYSLPGFGPGHTGGVYNWAGVDAFIYTSTLQYNRETNTITDMYGNTFSGGQTNESATADAGTDDGAEGEPQGQGEGLGLLKDIGTRADYASGVIGLTQLGMLEYRMSLPISTKIGTFSSFSTTYRGLGYASKSLGFLGYAGGLTGVYLDYKSLQSGEIGLGRFGYRTGSLGLSIYIGASIGGPWGAIGGAAVGGISIGAEYIYDNILQPLSREVNYQIWNFENALKNGWYPGR